MLQYKKNYPFAELKFGFEIGKVQTEDADRSSKNKIQEKDNEVFRMLNHITTYIIRKSDVDRLVKESVAKATVALKVDCETYEGNGNGELSKDG